MRALLLCVAGGVALFAAAPAARARVVLVGIDGGSWNLLDPALSAGELPALADLLARGVQADLASVEPVTSPVVWTSIATGRSPQAHGVGGFYATRQDVRVPSAFERLAARGLRVGTYDFLVTWPPPSFPGGFAIPGWMRRDAAIAPPDAFARAALEPYVYSVYGVNTPDEVAENVRRELAEKPRRFTRLLETFRPDVAAVTFYALDPAAHRFWKDAFPASFEGSELRPDPRFRDVIPDVLRGLDGALGEIAAALGPGDSLVVVSDHGFRADPGSRVWRIDALPWLARAGLDPARDGFEIGGGFDQLALRVLPGEFAEREAVSQRLIDAFRAARNEAGETLVRVDVLDGAERPPAAERSLLQRMQQLAMRALLRVLKVDLRAPAHSRVFVGARVDRIEAMWPDGRVRFPEGEVPISRLVNRFDFSGDHAPVGIFVAAGRGIRKAPERLSLSVLDVAPLLFYLAGQPLPDDLEGALPRALLAPDFLAANPPGTIPAADAPGLPDEPPAPAEPLPDDALRDRLRSLGYED